ncbi:hypothetical protein Tco_0275824 [Tanacetum coccineum]
MTFSVMCKAYDTEPTVDLLRAFLNLGPTSNRLTLSNRGSLFYIKNKIIPSEYPELLLEDNKLDKKSFKDVIPQHVQEDPLYNLIATYPVNVRTFPDPILYLAGLKTSWEHSPKEPIIYYRRKERISIMRQESPSVSMNNETPTTYMEPLNVVAPSHFAENMADSNDTPSEKDEVPHILLTAGEPSDPLDVDSDPDIHEFLSAKALKDSTDCHWVVAHVTPPSWKQHLKEINLDKLCDIHDKACMRQVLLDNIMNKMTHELMSTLSEAMAAYDAIQEKEKEKDKAYAEFEAKCNDALQDLDKNPLVLDLRAEIKILHGQVSKLHDEYSSLVLEEKKWVNYDQTLAILHFKEIDGLKQDRVAVVVKVVPYVAMELVRSDKMGLLVARLVKTALVHASASYPFLTNATADAYAPLEVLLSKNPMSFLSNFAPSQSKSKPSSLKVPNPDSKRSPCRCYFDLPGGMLL